MSSAISCIVIKSDLFPKKVPAPGQIVRVVGETGSFVVMHVDHRMRMVQLMRRSGHHSLFEVPFASVRVFNRKLAHAIHRLLDAGDEAEGDYHAR